MERVTYSKSKCLLEDENERNKQIDKLHRCDDDENEPTSIDVIYRNLKLKPSAVSLKELINGLHVIFENDEVNIEEVHALMSAYKNNPAGWLKYAKFNRFKYTRNLVDDGNGKFNLMMLCWGEGHGSSIHNHADSHCFMKIIAGSLCETRFEWPKTESNNEDEILPMKQISKKILNTDEVCYINDSLGLHRVENLSYSDYAMSLHLYCPPFNECTVFNERTGYSTQSKVVFWSIYGERDKHKKEETINPEDN